jgi:adhesin transport system outer membrane protein
MNAMIANVWSANSAADVQKATMLPRFDIRARQDVWHDKDDINGRYEEGVIELAMTYNLYNGGSDRAERRRLLFKANQAEDMRTQTCRNVRQEVSIAYNEMRATDEQLIFLDRHQTSIDKARTAYRRQFDIGQRTLLDMLDTENEYFMARRAYVNARRLNAISYTRALAGTGALVSALELGNDLHPMEKPSTDEETPDMAAVCPPEPDVAPLIDKDAIYREAIRKQGELQHLVAPDAPTATPADVSVEAMRAGTVTRGTGASAPDAATPEQPAKASDGW